MDNKVFLTTNSTNIINTGNYILTLNETVSDMPLTTFTIYIYIYSEIINSFSTQRNSKLCSTKTSDRTVYVISNAVWNQEMNCVTITAQGMWCRLVYL